MNWHFISRLTLLLDSDLVISHIHSLFYKLRVFTISCNKQMLHNNICKKCICISLMMLHGYRNNCIFRHVTRVPRALLLHYYYARNRQYKRACMLVRICIKIIVRKHVILAQYHFWRQKKLIVNKLVSKQFRAFEPIQNK